MGERIFRRFLILAVAGFVLSGILMALVVVGDALVPH